MAFLGANITRSSTYKQIITLISLFINKQALEFKTINPSFNNLGFKV
jgi:hypothetical protein